LLKNPHFYHTFFVWVPCNHFNFFSLPSNWFFSITMFVFSFRQNYKKKIPFQKKNHFSKTKVPKKNWMDDDYDQISYFLIFFF
jgi:hypothetical protein